MTDRNDASDFFSSLLERMVPPRAWSRGAWLVLAAAVFVVGTGITAVAALVLPNETPDEMSRLVGCIAMGVVTAVVGAVIAYMRQLRAPTLFT